MDYVGLLALMVFMGIPCAYVTRAMYLREQDSHEGPFRSSIKRVKFPTGHIQSVAFFDYIRRLFGVYRVDGDYWSVRDERNRVEAFTCPFCLSFWTALPFTVIFSALLYFLSGLDVGAVTVMAIPAHFGIAIVAQLVYKALWENE